VAKPKHNSENGTHHHDGDWTFFTSNFIFQKHVAAFWTPQALTDWRVVPWCEIMQHMGARTCCSAMQTLDLPS
jgi:hypothetical protein